ncbi:MAG: hypothetical protein QW254_03370 [Desulfurococcaceae archaeon]
MIVHLRKAILLVQFVLAISAMLAVFTVNIAATIVGLILFVIMITYLNLYLEKSPTIREMKAILTLSFTSITLGVLLGLVIGYYYNFIDIVLTGVSIILLILIYMFFIERALK